MPVECPRCHSMWEDLQHKEGEPHYSMFGDKCQKYICPSCEAHVVHTGSSGVYLDADYYVLRVVDKYNPVYPNYDEFQRRTTMGTLIRVWKGDEKK